MNDVIKLALGSVVRHALSGVGGSLIGIGISQATSNSFIASSEEVSLGVIAWGVSQIWSFIQKKQAVK